MADEEIARDEKKNSVKRSRDHAQTIRDAALGKLSDAASEKSTKKMKTDSEDLDLAGLVNCAKALMQSPAIFYSKISIRDKYSFNVIISMSK